MSDGKLINFKVTKKTLNNFECILDKINENSDVRLYRSDVFRLLVNKFVGFDWTKEEIKKII